MKLPLITALAGLMAATALTPAVADDSFRDIRPLIQLVDDDDDDDDNRRRVYRSWGDYDRDRDRRASWRYGRDRYDDDRYDRRRDWRQRDRDDDDDDDDDD